MHTHGVCVCSDEYIHKVLVHKVLGVGGYTAHMECAFNDMLAHTWCTHVRMVVAVHTLIGLICFAG
jgi:hypothetical protein